MKDKSCTYKKLKDNATVDGISIHKIDFFIRPDNEADMKASPQITDSIHKELDYI